MSNDRDLRDDGSVLARSSALWDMFERTGDIVDLDEAISILRRVTEGSSPAGASAGVAALSNLGAALLRRFERTDDVGYLDEAISILRQALEAPGSGRPDHVAVLSTLGDALRVRIEHAGPAARTNESEQLRQFAAEAIFVYEQVVSERRRSLGNEHPDTLAAMNNLAAVLQDQGDFDGAKLLHEHVAGVSRRVLGGDHPSTLASMNNLAAVFRDQGDLAAARSLSEPTLSRVAVEQCRDRIVLARLHDAVSLARGDTQESLTRKHAASTESDVAGLIKSAQQGDASGWGVLVESYTDLLLRVTRNYRIEHVDVQDVVQNVWSSVLGSIDRVNPSNLRSLLITATRRECLRILRERNREVASLLESDIPEAAPYPNAGHEEGADSEFLRREAREELQAALQKLPEQCRRLLILLTSDERVSYARISAELDIPVGSIGPTRARCLNRLRRLLEVRADAGSETGT